MQIVPVSHLATWGIVAVATGGVIIRPWGLPEAVWVSTGAVALVTSTLLPWHEAFASIAKGADVYLFLIGMMLLAELARREGLFDWLAAHAAKAAMGSSPRLFGLVYLVGIVVTTLLSNDATAVVLTPAVYAAAKAANAKPLPYLMICAFIANAASFVLPISNPANLVLYNNHMPSLLPWIKQFGLPSLAAILVTYLSLRWVYRHDLKARIATGIIAPDLSDGGRYTAFGIGLTAIVLLLSSAFDLQLGAPTFAAGSATALVVLAHKRETPWPLVGGISWGILPLVAGLFVLVAGPNNTGVTAYLTHSLQWGVQQSVTATAFLAGTGLAFASNLLNNLPAGLIAESAVAQAHLPSVVTSALLIGVDLGPNLSVTGSLATILWLTALRREGERVTAVEFLKVGAVVMIPALILTLTVLVLTT